MSTLSEKLQDKDAGGVYFLDTEATIEELHRLVASIGFQFFYIDGKRISDKRSFLKKIAEAMHFPSYYGENWDAFEECITDLGWLSASGYVLLYDHFDRFSTKKPGEWKIAFDILHSAAEHWKREGVPMYILLRGNTSAVTGLPILTLK